MLRIPVYLTITSNKPFFDRSCPYIPGLLGIIEERRLATPAEGIGMANPLTAIEQPPGFKVIQNKRVSILNKLTLEGIIASNNAL